MNRQSPIINRHWRFTDTQQPMLLELRVLSAPSYPFVMRADLDESGAVRHHNQVRHAVVGSR
jgi:hypothetical protein